MRATWTEPAWSRPPAVYDPLYGAKAGGVGLMVGAAVYIGLSSGGPSEDQTFATADQHCIAARARLAVIAEWLATGWHTVDQTKQPGPELAVRSTG